MPRILLELARVLQARHLDENAVDALALDIGLGRAQGIDALAQHLDRLIDGAPDLVTDPGVSDGQLNEFVGGLVEVDGGPARGGQLAADRLGQGLQFRQDLGPLVEIGQPELDALLCRANAAGYRDLFLAQKTPHVVTQILDLGLGHRSGIDLEQDMGAALQIETEHDRPDR